MTLRRNTHRATVGIASKVLDTRPDKAAYNRVAKYSARAPLFCRERFSSTFVPYPTIDTGLYRYSAEPFVRAQRPFGAFAQ